MMFFNFLNFFAFLFEFSNSGWVRTVRNEIIVVLYFFFFNDPSPPEIYPLSLHDALPIGTFSAFIGSGARLVGVEAGGRGSRLGEHCRSEEHTSELQSHVNLVCRLLL